MNEKYCDMKYQYPFFHINLKYKIVKRTSLKAVCFIDLNSHIESF